MEASLSATSVRSAFAGLALLMASGAALAAEPRISDAEKPLARKAICAAAKKPVITPDDLKNCVAYIESRNKANDWAAEEQMKGIEAVCRVRYSSDPQSFYETCRTDLGVTYNLLAVKMGAGGKQETSYVSACGKGMGIALLGAVALQGAAAVADLLGCFGACSAVAAKVNGVGLVGIAAAGCTAGFAAAVVSDMTESSTQQPPRTIPRPAPAPGR